MSSNFWFSSISIITFLYNLTECCDYFFDQEYPITTTTISEDISFTATPTTISFDLKLDSRCVTGPCILFEIVQPGFRQDPAIQVALGANPYNFQVLTLNSQDWIEEFEIPNSGRWLFSDSTYHSIQLIFTESSKSVIVNDTLIYQSTIYNARAYNDYHPLHTSDNDIFLIMDGSGITATIKNICISSVTNDTSPTSPTNPNISSPTAAPTPDAYRSDDYILEDRLQTHWFGVEMYCEDTYGNTLGMTYKHSAISEVVILQDISCKAYLIYVTVSVII